jgi:hypothetical protein
MKNSFEAMIIVCYNENTNIDWLLLTLSALYALAFPGK